jgi:3-oxoadipate enol-lactonase
MNILDLESVKIHYREQGQGVPLVFINSLMTDFRMWDKLLTHLRDDYRVIRYDKRSHGLSTMPPGPYAMSELVDDLAKLLDSLKVRDAVVVGLSVGGLIAQGLAASRPDLVRAMVLSNTASTIGTKDVWEGRFKAIRDGGLEAIVDPTLDRWFPPKFHETPEIHGWRTMFLRQPRDAFLFCGKAISETDYSQSTAKLKIPVLGIGGSEDTSTPADLLKQTIDTVAGGRFHLIEGSGHLPCVDASEEYARVLRGFLDEVLGG